MLAAGEWASSSPSNEVTMEVSAATPVIHCAPCLMRDTLPHSLWRALLMPSMWPNVKLYIAPPTYACAPLSDTVPSSMTYIASALHVIQCIRYMTPCPCAVCYNIQFHGVWYVHLCQIGKITLFTQSVNFIKKTFLMELLPEPITDRLVSSEAAPGDYLLGCVCNSQYGVGSIKLTAD